MGTLSQIRLRYYTDEEIRVLAVVRVTHASTYDRGVPKPDGINDARMGLVDHTVRCPTCFKANCDQHFGYIDLEKPVYRLGSIATVIMLLRSVCRECAMPKFGDGGLVLSAAISAMEPSRDKLRAISDACRTRFWCTWCKAPQPVYTKRARTFVDCAYRPRELSSEFVKNRGPDYTSFLKARFMPEDAAAVLHGLSLETAAFLGLDRPSSLMCRLQIVPPPCIRPSNFIGETKVRSENDLTSALQDVVRSNIELKNAIENNIDIEKAYDKLQVMVSGIVNHAIKRSAAQSGLLPLVAATSKRKIVDLKARLNGKKARVRGNLNGKRVDQSGRTVISGDASHDIDQLGVPMSMMNKLTFPDMVTNINMARMAKCVVTGAYATGGALAVRPPSHAIDHVIWLPMLEYEARIDLAAQLRPGWIVERHLIDGDWVLFNRQPSLWKASMMAFRCYAVTGLTVRLPLPVTRAFNADFDGDEMNIHALQGYEAIAEAQELMAVPHQIVTPQSNSVIIGLVQDSLVGAWRLTAQDCFFDRNEAIELLTAVNYDTPGRGSSKEDYCDLTGARPVVFRDLWLPEPAILRPQLWTGKQLFSLIVPTSVNIIKAASFDELTGPTGLVVRHGSMLCGRLNKSYLGAASTGLVHAVWRLYGPGGAHKFISDAQRMLVKHLGHDGPTQSIVDCLVPSEESYDILSKNLGRSDAILGLKLTPEVMEAKASSILQETLRSVGAAVLAKVRPECALANCVNSGSKGNVMNIAQIAGCVGQQTVYGRRIPLRTTRLGPRTLVYYSPGDMRAETRGFISNSYVSGLSPAEFFEHQMAGREGIVATAVNTSESGYNQRRMIKGQESQCVGYDGTVRVSSNIIIQSLYGGDDLDGSRLERVRLPWLFAPQSVLGPLIGVECVSRALKVATDHAVFRANLFKDADVTFPCGIAIGAIIGAYKNYNYDPRVIERFAKLLGLIHMRQHSSTQALMNISVACAILQAAEWRFKLDNAVVDQLIQLYSKAIVAAGEGVGALGASCIGEPSMQMTLNVFHYSGIADKNVTITGLPRFKQLINSVDTYETANMTAKLSFENTHLALQISKVMLSEVVVQGSLYSLSTDHVHPGFELFGALRGPFSIKFSAPPTAMAPVARLTLDWTRCARKHIDTATIARALRETLSYDAICVAGPHWLNEPIKIYFAPWISAAAVPAICEGLLANQQVRGIDYVNNSITFQEKIWASTGQCSSRHVVETEGSNIVDLARCDFIVPETIKSTNVVEMARVLGIAAGLVVLQSELHKVLAFDSAYIDPRHTWLLADTMGRSGVLAAMNRHHMETLGSSLLQRASFEQSLDVFEEGAAFGRSDPLAGATERIIVGQPVSIGTGIMGTVCGAQTQAQEVLVAPMDDHAAAPASIVRPLNFRSERHFDASAYASRYVDMDRICAHDFLVSCISKFRGLAASKRQAPTLRFTMKLNEALHKAILAECWGAQWSRSETTHLVTDVYWPFGNFEGHTQTIMSPKTIKNYCADLLARDARDGVECSIFIKKTLEALEVPFGVEVSRVVIKQQAYFEKGVFSLTLARQWTGSNNVETEALALSTSGTLTATLETIESESILQNRCTDAQLANAIAARLPI